MSGSCWRRSGRDSLSPDSPRLWPAAGRQVSGPAVWSSCSVQLFGPAVLSSCSVQLFGPAVRSSCSIQRFRPAVRSSCSSSGSVQRFGPAVPSSCSVQRFRPAVRSSCSVQLSVQLSVLIRFDSPDSLTLSTDVRQRLGKRPYSPDRRRSPSPVSSRETPPSREPIRDVHRRLGVASQDSRGLYSNSSKDRKTSTGDTL